MKLHFSNQIFKTLTCKNLDFFYLKCMLNSLNNNTFILFQLQEMHEDEYKGRSRGKKMDKKTKIRSKSEERAKKGPASLTQDIVQEDITNPFSHSPFSETSV